MITSREYRQFASECTKWADETDTSEARKAFLELARDWIFAALLLDRGGTAANAQPAIRCVAQSSIGALPRRAGFHR
jgi:hypothetical protein